MFDSIGSVYCSPCNRTGCKKCHWKRISNFNGHVVYFCDCYNDCPNKYIDNCYVCSQCKYKETCKLECELENEK